MRSNMELGIVNYVNLGLMYFAIVPHIFFNDQTSVQAIVDYTGCKTYDVNSTKPYFGSYIGETWSKKYYIMNQTGTFFDGAFSTCGRYGLQIASIRTACEYRIIQNWFLSKYPTAYYAWIGGFRMGPSTQPLPFWINTGEPMDFSQFERNAAYIAGPYPPGGYSPIVYPWINCLAVSRNCPVFTSGPTNPCTQTPTYPDIEFMWLDCRISTPRVICEETSYTKEDLMNEIDSD